MENNSFGYKMLGKMGWKEGQKIGKNPLSYIEDIKDVESRRMGLGLGANNKEALTNVILNDNDRLENQ